MDESCEACDIRTMFSDFIHQNYRQEQTHFSNFFEILTFAFARSSFDFSVNLMRIIIRIEYALIYWKKY